MRMIPMKGREMHPSHAFYRRRVMGSTGSLLNEGVDQGEGERRTNRYHLDEYMLPSKITPYGGRLDKPKGLVKPIAVRANSPGSAPSSPGYIKRGSGSPSPSDSHTHGQPPDVVLTNQRRGITSPNGFASTGRYFTRPPTKTVSLQEIAPSSKTMMNGTGEYQNNRQSSSNHRQLQPSQSMNFLDYNQRSRPQPFGQRGRSYSHSSVAESSPQLTHKSLSPPPEHRAVDDLSTSSHVSSIIEEISTDEEVPNLRNQVQELESQLVSLRQSMEQNEESILQVQEAKRQQWQEEMDRLKREGEEQRDRATDLEQSLHQQIQSLEDENIGLKEKMQHLGESSQNLRNHGGRQQPDQNARPDTGRRKGSLLGEVAELQRQLSKEKERVAGLEGELERTQSGQWHESPDLVKRQTETQLRTDLDKLNEVKVNLTKQVSIQEDELQSLHRKLQHREKAIAQDQSELEYLKEVQDGLQSTLIDRESEIKQLRHAEHAVRSALEGRIRERDMELDVVRAELREIRIERNRDVSQLEKQVLRKESEVLQLQGQIQETEAKTKPKRRSLKGSSTETSKSSQKNTQKQLEQDFIALQVKLTKREQELFQLRREYSLKQDNLREERDGACKRLSQVETDLKACLERLELKDEEISLSREKLHDREREIADLYEKLERLKEQHQLAPNVGQVDNQTDRQTVSNVGKSGQESKLASNVGPLEGAIRELQERMRAQEVAFKVEKETWQKEKDKVLQYQKQLQLNYMQMGQKNRKLEQEVQQLSSELEHTDVIHC